MHLDPILSNSTSVSGVGTCIQVPSKKLTFDMGVVPRSAVGKSVVLITHSHMDHIGGLADHCARRELMGLPAPTYIVNPDILDRMKALFAAFRALDGSRLEPTWIPLSPGEEWSLPSGDLVRPFQSIHRPDCQGYGIWSQRKRLREDLGNISGREIKELRKQGVEVNEWFYAPEIVYTGDTRIEVLENEEVVRNARLLIMECTFLDEQIPVQVARDRWHVHLDEVIARANLFCNEQIILTHFSARYTSKEVNTHMNRLPDGLRSRVVPLAR